jgi:TolB protein
MPPFQNRRLLLTAIGFLVLLVVILLRWNLPRPLTGELLLSMSFSDLRLGGLYTFDLTRREYQRMAIPDPIPPLAVSYNPILSADQQHLAFQTFDNGQSLIHIARSPADSTIIASTTGPRDFQPQWSPDGRWVIFGRAINSISALLMLDPLTGEERQLTDFTNDIEPDWSPDGLWIVFTTSRDGFQELYRMAPDGSRQERLTENVNINDLYAHYSPDGQYIAYMTNYSVGDGTGEIWVMNADGSDQRQLTNNDRDDGAPVWLPDSRHLTYTTSAADRSGSALWVVDVTTGAARQLTNLPGHAYRPVWSPDGEWVVFTYTPGGSASDLYAMRADGSALQLLIKSSELGVHSVEAQSWLRQP